MSTSELGAVESLLGRVLPDPEGFAERVLRQVLERMSTDPAQASPPERLPAYDSTGQELFTDRNLLFAAAVGACECWGEDPDCPTCAGGGSAGWAEPDAELYAEYVAPAVLRSAGDPESGSVEPETQCTEGAPHEPHVA